MLKKILYPILISAVIIIMGLSILLGAMGISSILLTTTFYVLLLMISRQLCAILVRSKQMALNMIVLTSTLCVSLFLVEIALRYVFKVGLERQELNGEFLYSLPYHSDIINRLARKYVLKIDDPFLINRSANEVMIKSASEFEYTTHYNSIGLPGKEPIQNDSLFTIVSLGDSYTEGIGTPEDSTWTYLLEKKLNTSKKKYDNGKTIQCINGGFSGSDPFSEYFILEKLLLPYNPQLVLIGINCTDVTDVIKAGGWERFSTYKKPPWWGYLYQFSYIIRAVMHGVFHVNWLLLTPAQYKIEEQKAINLIYTCITEKYVPLAKKKDMKIAVIVHPTLQELEKNDFSLNSLAESLKAQNLQVINLFEEFKVNNSLLEQPERFKSIYWLQDGHHNSRGYSLWADIVAENIF